MFIFILTVIQINFSLQLVRSPPTGQLEECRFIALLNWLHFSEPEVAALFYLRNTGDISFADFVHKTGCEEVQEAMAFKGFI